MARCARCGAPGANPPRLNNHGEYNYCDDCQDQFDRARQNGITARSRHGNREFREYPYEVSIAPQHTDKLDALIGQKSTTPQSQTEALAICKRVMDRYDIPGLFLYQKTGSVWLIDEYLQAHPSISQDIRREIVTMSSGDSSPGDV